MSDLPKKLSTIEQAIFVSIGTYTQSYAHYPQKSSTYVGKKNRERQIVELSYNLLNSTGKKPSSHLLKSSYVV